MATASPALLLGLDIGSSHIKAVLLDGEGNEAGRARVATPFVTTAAGTEATLGDLEQAVAGALTGLGAGAQRVAGVGVAGMAESGSPFDARGRPLAPIIAWHDPRGTEVADRVAERCGPDVALRIGRALRPVSSVAKLGWLVDHGVTGVDAWLGVPELCLHALTGSRATEPSLASCSGCWDVIDREWLPQVGAAAGFDTAVFPAVRPAGTVMGHVTAPASSWSGLARGTPVTLAGHDHLAAAVGSGALADDLVNSIGTAETVLVRVPDRPDVAAAVDQRLAVGVNPGGEGWALLAGAARAGQAVAAAADALGRTPDELDALVSESRRSSPPQPSAELLESLRNRQQPRLPAAPDVEAWATLLAALAACTADAVSRLSSVVGPRKRMVAVGGGAAKTLRLQATARAVTVPVWRSGATEAAARGAAAFAGVAAGWWPSVDAVLPPALEKVTPTGRRRPATDR